MCKALTHPNNQTIIFLTAALNHHEIFTTLHGNAGNGYHGNGLIWLESFYHSLTSPETTSAEHN